MFYHVMLPFCLSLKTVNFNHDNFLSVTSVKTSFEHCRFLLINGKIKKLMNLSKECVCCELHQSSVCPNSREQPPRGVDRWSY